MLEGLKQPEMTGYLDQTGSYLRLLLAYVYLKKGDPEQARQAMNQALELADRFDSSPNYDARSVRFVERTEQFSLHSITGRTARDGLGYLVSLNADDQLTALWEEMTGND